MHNSTQTQPRAAGLCIHSRHKRDPHQCKAPRRRTCTEKAQCLPYSSAIVPLATRFLRNTPTSSHQPISQKTTLAAVPTRNAVTHTRTAHPLNLPSPRPALRQLGCRLDGGRQNVPLTRGRQRRDRRSGSYMGHSYSHQACPPPPHFFTPVTTSWPALNLPPGAQLPPLVAAWTSTAAAAVAGTELLPIVAHLEGTASGGAGGGTVDPGSHAHQQQGTPRRHHSAVTATRQLHDERTPPRSPARRPPSPRAPAAATWSWRTVPWTDATITRQRPAWPPSLASRPPERPPPPLPPRPPSSGSDTPAKSSTTVARMTLSRAGTLLRPSHAQRTVVATAGSETRSPAAGKGWGRERKRGTRWRWRPAGGTAAANDAARAVSRGRRRASYDSGARVHPRGAPRTPQSRRVRHPFDAAAAAVAAPPQRLLCRYQCVGAAPARRAGAGKEGGRVAAAAGWRRSQVRGKGGAGVGVR